MVGIPSSKGCATCRNRKVRCDQQRPFCQRCVKAKRVCEGYERFPVFIQKTGQGLVPRKRFEEVKPSSENVLIQQLASDSDIWNIGVISWFWTEHATGHGPWLRYAIDISSPTAALQTSLLALTCTRFGRVTQNQDMVLHGQRIYSDCLVLVQKALYHPDLMFHDETLASIRAMALYELFEATSNDPVGWQNHLSGISHLIEVRGPSRYRSPLARAVLADVRYALMLKALLVRKESIFGRKEWLMEWDSPEQKFYDLGFRLAALLEQTDKGLYNMDAFNTLLQSLSDMDSQLVEPELRLNWLACRLLFNFAASRLGFKWVSESSELADVMMDMLPAIVVGKSHYRCIFPLTCLVWHYRMNEEKTKEVQELRNLLARGRKVRFAGGKHDVKAYIPKVARD